MKKFFTFLFAALMSVSMFAATTVTWNRSTLSSISLAKGGSFPNDGVTLTALNGTIENEQWTGYSSDASFKFSTSLGNFTRIEITGHFMLVGGSGWTQTDPGAVWIGEANETTLGGIFDNLSQIVFTIEDPAPQVTTHTLKLVSNDETMGSVAVTNLLGSGIIDNGDGTYAVPEGVQATVLATPKEGYQFALWRYSEKLNDFNDNCYYCGRLVYDLPLANPWTINALTEDEAILAIFEEAAPSDPNVATWGTGFLSYINAYRKEVHGGENVNKDNVKDGITAFYEGTRNSDGLSWGQMYVTGGVDSKLIFSHESRKFTKIEIYGVLTQYSTTAFNDWAWNAEIGAFVWEGEPTDSVIVQSTNGSEKISMVGLKRIVFSLEHSTEAISNTAANVNAVKVVRNGQVLILKNGKTFNALGAEVR